MTSNMESNKFRHVDILSFDGGGSRGIMEASILSDVMRLVTLVWQDPTKLSYLSESGDLKNAELREKLINDLKNVPSPLHPTEVYDMIVGTSTGALIAFGLVGGRDDGNGKRSPMTLDECIHMYQEKSKGIFSKSWSHYFLSFLPGLGSIPLTTYPQDNVKKALLEQFGESSLADLKRSDTIRGVAGAVAKQLGQKEELVLFDTSTEAYKLYKTHQVLLATSNAPVYFDTPVKIGNKEFVDGGVGGNCPLVQAIPRAKEIFGDKAKITSALSIAPPSPKESHIPRRFQIKYWLNYFVQEATDGYAVYKVAERRNKHTHFKRLAPRGERLKDFKLDEVDAEKMLTAMKVEKSSNEMFLVDVIATAMVVVDTYFDKIEEEERPEMTTVKIAAQLAQNAGNIYSGNKEYELAINSYETSIRLWKKITNANGNDNGNEDTDVVIAEIHDNIAQCFEKQEDYQSAIELYRSSVKRWITYDNSENTAKALLNLAVCLLSSYRYDEAEGKLELFLEKHGEDKLNSELVAQALDHMGWCKTNKGQSTEAVELFKKSLKMKKELYSTDSDHLEIAETLNNLGICYSDLSENDKAVEYVRDSYDIRKRLIQEEDHPLLAESLNNLGWCFMESEHVPEAHTYFEMALAMNKRLYGGVDNLSVAISMENYAKCLLHENQIDHALEYAQQALQIKKTHLGDANNPGIAKTLNIIGLCYEEAGNSEEATGYFRKSERMKELVFGLFFTNRNGKSNRRLPLPLLMEIRKISNEPKIY